LWVLDLIEVCHREIFLGYRGFTVLVDQNLVFSESKDAGTLAP
jgi:hypothetical protein